MPLHVTAACLLEGPAGQADRCFDELLERLDRLVRSRPLLRLGVHRSPLGLHNPWWVEWRSVDPARHVSRMLASGDRPEDVERTAASVLTIPMRMDRPLWDLWLVESRKAGVATTRALVMRAHHALSDGLAGIEVVAGLFDAALFDAAPAAGRNGQPGTAPAERRVWSPTGGRPGGRLPGGRLPRHQPEDAAPPSAVPSVAAMLAYEMVGLAFRPVVAGVALRHTASAVFRAGRTWSALEDGSKKCGGGCDRRDGAAARVSNRVPRTLFNRAITARREVSFSRVAVSDLRAVRRRAGVGLNDVVLALCSGAVRAYLLDRSALPARSLVALVPLALRADTGRDGLRNRVGAVQVPLATEQADALERLGRIGAFTASAGGRPAVTAGLASEWLDVFSPAAASLASKTASALNLFDHVRLPFNLVVSAVPGPRAKLALAATELDAIHPLGPVVEGAALNITAVSYAGKFHFGVVSCPDVVDDAKSIAERLPLELDGLLAATSTR